MTEHAHSTVKSLAQSQHEINHLVSILIIRPKYANKFHSHPFCLNTSRELFCF